jgi:hypothetical protein
MAGVKGKSGGRRSGSGRPFEKATLRPGPARADVDGEPVAVRLEVRPDGTLVIVFPNGQIVVKQ